MNKRIVKGFTKRRFILFITACLSLLLSCVLWIIASGFIKDQESQRMAQRWSEEGDVAQISCFFSVNTYMTPDQIEELEYKLGNRLQEQSIINESSNSSARLWADAYSAYGKITVNSEIGNITADAIGIGGDFFLFHPLKLLTGSFFSGNDLMQDYCILDEDAAWKLFGSNDIAGQIVTIKGVPHMVLGVIERENGKLAEAAGLDSSVIYVSYDTLNRYGSHSGINHYEIVMPDPVKGYAQNTIKELFSVDEQDMEIVNNTERFDLLNRIKLITSFGIRSMNGKAIIYPYWENMIRGLEDILMVLTVFAILLLIYPVTVIAVTLIILWKRRTWTVKSIWKKIRGGNIYEKKCF